MELIGITESARLRLGALLAGKSESPATGLRLAVNKGGCAGWQYEMKVAEPLAGDVIVDHGGVRVIVAGESIDMLRGCELDYTDELTDSGFRINNPKARRSCGCGTSFEPDDAPEGSAAADGEVCGGEGAD